MIPVAAVVAGILLLAVAVPVTMILGFRTRNRTILGAIRRINKRFVNPRQLRTAGSPGAYAAVLRHRGRRSGRAYETPLGAMPTADGDFVIMLPYGTDTDWLRNLRAAGSAVLVYEGAEYAVREPTVIPIDSASVAPGDSAAIRLLRVESALRLRAKRIG